MANPSRGSSSVVDDRTTGGNVDFFHTPPPQPIRARQPQGVDSAPSPASQQGYTKPRNHRPVGYRVYSSGSEEAEETEAGRDARGYGGEHEYPVEENVAGGGASGVARDVDTDMCSPEDEHAVAMRGVDEAVSTSDDAQLAPQARGENPNDQGEKEGDAEDRFNEVEKRARVALEAIAVRDDDVEVNMPNYVATLKEYRLACEQRHMYKEAHLVQQVLRNLRLEEETRHVRGLTEMQMEDRRVLEETHRAEFREFHRLWNEKIDDFEERQLEMEITLLERQNEELLRFHEEMRDFDPRGIPRFSRSLLAARQKQQALARQKSYVSAQEEKLRGDAIELMDIEKYEHTRSQMYERREYALRYQHQQELLALRLKVESKRLYLEKARKRELDEVLQRYINARNEMEVQQNIVRNKTGALLLKHACNDKTDSSGSATLVESAYSGTFGTIVKKRAIADQKEQQQQQRTLKDRQATSSSSSHNTRPTSQTAPLRSDESRGSRHSAPSSVASSSSTTAPSDTQKQQRRLHNGGVQSDEGAALRYSADRR